MPASARPVPALTAVVLCGGASTRMGRDKATLLHDGLPLWRHVAQRVGLVADPVLLAPGTPGRFGTTGFREVIDAPVGAGPLGGIVGALEASPHSLVAAVAVDMPFVSPSVLTGLARLREHEDAVVPVDEHGLQPLHAVYARSALEPLKRALDRGEFGMRAVLRALSVRTVARGGWSEWDPTGMFATNVNTPDDVELLLRGGEQGAGDV